jgi:hypothetical protein
MDEGTRVKLAYHIRTWAWAARSRELGSPKDKTSLVRCCPYHMGLDTTFLRIQPCEWRDPVPASRLGGAAGEPMGAGSTSQTPSALPGRRSCLAAPHVETIRDERTHAVAVLANVQAARQELPFQEPNARFVQYLWTISGRD